MIRSDDGLSVLPCARSAYDQVANLVRALPAGVQRDTAAQALNLLGDVINGLRREITFPSPASGGSDG